MNTENPKQDSSIDLKAVREGKGLSLKGISHQSRISVSILEAIEKRNFHLLPEPVYTRGFIRTYAQILEINDEEILSAYNAYIDEIDMSQQQVETERKTETSRARYTVLGIIIAILFVMFIIFVMSSNFERQTAPTVPPPPAAEEVKEIPPVPPVTEGEIKEKPGEGAPPEATKEGPAPVRAGEEPITSPVKDAADTGIKPPAEKRQQVTPPATESEQVAKESRETYLLEIEATELTWLNIITDFKPNEEILMKPGEKIIRKASEKFIVYIGNAGGVDVSFQGATLGPLGEHGKVIRLVLPPKPKPGGEETAR